MIRIPTDRKAVHPGEVLLEEFLKPMGETQTELAKAIGVPFQRVNEIISGKRGVTASTALRLARHYGNSAGFWLNLQMRCDLQIAAQLEKDELKRVKPIDRIAA